MSRPTPASEMTPVEHIARAKAEVGQGVYESALVHALIAIAEQGEPAGVTIVGDLHPARTFTDDRGHRWEWCGGQDGTWAWRITARTVRASDLCAKPEPDQVSAAARAMCGVLFGEGFDLHGQGDDDRAHYERAAEAAIEAAR